MTGGQEDSVAKARSVIRKPLYTSHQALPSSKKSSSILQNGEEDAAVHVVMSCVRAHDLRLRYTLASKQMQSMFSPIKRKLGFSVGLIIVVPC